MTGSVTATPSEPFSTPLSAPLLAACAAERAALVGRSRIWVAFSGGADSTALLRSLVAADLGIPLFATHIDHGVHQASAEWAHYCTKICEELGVTLQIHRATPPSDGRFEQGFEAWARAQRYRHWQELVGEDEVLLCAHHADDQAETVALRLLQGRLPLPMPKSRALGDGQLLRPFLGLRAAALREALRDAGSGWLEDPSNSDTRLLRNRVRKLLPKLPAEGDWFCALVRCGELLARRQVALAAAFGFDSSSVESAPLAGELVRLPLSALTQPEALQGLLALFGGGPVTHRQAANALAALARQTKTGASSGAARGGVRMGDGSNLWLYAAGAGAASAEVVVWREPAFEPHSVAVTSSARISLPHGDLTLRFEDVEATAPVVVRSLLPAEQILCNGRWLKVKELLRASGVPRWARRSYPVVVAGHPTVVGAGSARSGRDTLLAVPALAASGAVGWLCDQPVQPAPVSALWHVNLPS